MELMHELRRTEELLHRGLKEINDKGELNNSSLDVLGKTLDAVKDLCEIKEKDSQSYGRGMWTSEGVYGRRDGDGDGRYYEGRRGYEGYGNRGGNYGGNYNGNYGESYGRNYGRNDEMVESLRRDMQNASTEQEREAIRKLLRKYENN